MIHIEKQREPQSLRRYRNTPGADFDGLEKTELRQCLLREQGYLCAYCMRRIREDKSVKIEHYVPRNKENQLLYSNLLAVCTGNQTLLNVHGKVDSDRFTCDTRKGNHQLHVDPTKKADMKTIYYDNLGTIYSTNPLYQTELCNYLNLNDPFGSLKSNRKAALDAVRNKMKRLKAGQDALPLLKKLEHYCTEKNAHGEYPEYAGIIRWYVEKHLKKYI